MGRVRRRVTARPARWAARCRGVFRKEPTMQDLLWIAVAVGLLASTLAYIRLCDKA
jgi:hypothetical protein